MANADILPFDFSGFVDNLAKFEKEVEELADKMREETEIQNELISSGVYGYTLDPTETLKPPPIKDPVPFLNFAPVQNALMRLQGSAEAYQIAWKATSNGASLSKANIEKLNTILFKAERYLTSEPGLPRRGWYRHKIYAPGFYTGYGVKTLPGIREGIEERYWDEVDQEMVILAATLNSFADQIDQATVLLK